jgi:hypothetical protein
MEKMTQTQMENMTSKELKRICIDDYGIVGVSKKPKEVVIAAILAYYRSKDRIADTQSGPSAAAPTKLAGVEFQGQSVVTKPGEDFGSRTTTTIHVSCGASSGNFPVVGRSVMEIGEFLREVLNVDRLSTGLVNGAEVSGDYMMQPGDHLEFLKPASKKG